VAPANLDDIEERPVNATIEAESVSDHPRVVGWNVLYVRILRLLRNSNNPAPTPSGGFPIFTFDEIDFNGLKVSEFPHGGASMSGHVVGPDNPNGLGTVYQFFGLITNGVGQNFVNDGRVFVNWNLTTSWTPDGCGIPPDVIFIANGTVFDVTPEAGVTAVCDIDVIDVPSASTHFVLQNSEPGTLTFGGTNLSTANGMPELLLYDRNGNIAASALALSVASDGSSATFPFPLTSTKGSLPPDLYPINILDAGSGSYTHNSANYLDIGASLTADSTHQYVSPFGVDAAPVTTQTTNCVTTTTTPPTTHCFTTTARSVDPVVTQYSTNQVTYQGQVIGVGANPTAIKTFNVQQVDTSDPNSDTMTQLTTEPTRAIVANAGSSSVSIVDLVNKVSVTSIPVAPQPVAIALNSSQSKAYVACYGGNALYEIDLATNAVSRTVGLTAGPLSLDIDSSHNTIWVGGQNFIAAVDLGSFSVVSSSAIQGAVNSIVTSPGQGQLLYTVVSGSAAGTLSAGGSTGTSTFTIGEMPLSPGASTTSSFQPSTATAYQTSTTSSALPSASLLAGGALSSVQYANDIAVVTTPTGFAVVDIARGNVVMQGTTPTPVRGMAADPDQGVVFLTAPDSNTVLRVPLPSQMTPALTMTASPVTQTVATGASTTFTISMTAMNGFTGNVYLGIDGLPDGSYFTSSQYPVPSSNGTSTLTVFIPANASPGTYPLKINGYSGGVHSTATASLSVIAPPDFSVAASPSSQTVTAGGTTSYTITTAWLNGFSGSITLSVAGLPPGLTASLSPTSVAAGSSSVLTLASTTATAAGTYTIPVTGTSGALSHTTNLTITVNAPPPPPTGGGGGGCVGRNCLPQN
jgi:hypothetical protein